MEYNKDVIKGSSLRGAPREAFVRSMKIRIASNRG